MQQARNYIAQALAFDNSHPNNSGVTVPNPVPIVPRTVAGSVNEPAGATTRIGQGRSNQSLADARRELETAIDALNRDAHDYGGFRNKALDAMQAARSQLLQALNFRHVQ